MRLLVAEDDSRLLKSLIRILELDGYIVDGVDNGTDALDYAMTGEYDGLVLDIMMMGMDGITVLRALREHGINTPAMFLTARTEVYQRVEGLDAGADDYLPKPFATSELLARIRAMLRRRDNYTPDTVTYNGLVLNCSTFNLSYGESSVSLSAREFQIMELLFASPGARISTDRMITHIWGWDTNVDVSVVWVHISNIRKKLDSLGSPMRIRFVRGAGYALEEEK